MLSGFFAGAGRCRSSSSKARHFSSKASAATADQLTPQRSSRRHMRSRNAGETRRVIRSGFLGFGLGLGLGITRVGYSHADRSRQSRQRHQLRHTYATWLISAGENIKWVSRQMGHKSGKMTLDTYADWLPSLDNEAGTTAVSMLWSGLGQGGAASV
jgi:integrase